MADNNNMSPELLEQAISEQNKIRLEKLQGLVEAGKDPYVLTKFDRTHLSTEVLENYAELEGKTKKDALAHPNWTMGAKITVDSATLMNKGLEIIEAMRLYRLPLSKVDAVIHRQSIIHSLVEYTDGALLAQLGTPDMKLPIRYAMTYPKRSVSPDKPLDLLSCPPLTFAAPDEEAFPCLAIAKRCAQEGGTSCAIMNGANEAAVALFLADKIGFCDIPRLVEKALSSVSKVSKPTLADILEADRLAREAVNSAV